MWPGPGPLTELAAAKDKDKKQDATTGGGANSGFKAKQKYGFKEYFADKKTKLQDQFGVDFEGPKKSSIFAGVAIWVNGHTDPSSAVLRQLMGEHGGRYDLYEAPETTHWICSWLPHAKVRLLRGTERIIKPSWIVDSIAAGRLLPESDYSLLPDLGFPKPKTSFFTRPAAQLARPSKAQSTNDTYPALNLSVPPAANPAHSAAVNLHEKESTPESPELFLSRLATTRLLLPQQLQITDSGVNVSNAAPLTLPPADSSAAPIVAPAALAQPQPPKGAPEDKVAFKTAKDDGFLENYRKSSRLHYLSTWKAQFQESLARELRLLLESDDASTPMRADDAAKAEGAEVTAFQLRHGDWNAEPCLKPHSGGGEGEDGVDYSAEVMQAQQEHTKVQNNVERLSVIVHCDMDCFFASVAQVSDPALLGKPVVVCHSSVSSAVGWSDVASASYEARKFGIRNGMSLSRARQLCPELRTAPYQFERYAQISRTVYSIFVKYSRRIQAVSCDEAYFELHVPSYAVAEEKVQRLREEIAAATGCNASAGLGPNMLVARLATKKAKPNGQRGVPPERVPSFMAALDVGDIPGVGHAITYSLQLLRVRTVGDLLIKTETELQEALGAKTGERLYMAARGVDDRQLQCFNVRKSIGVDLNWGVRLKTQQEVAKVVDDLAKELAGRAVQSGVQGRTITLRILQRREGAATPRKFLGHGIVDAHSRSVTLRVPTAAQQDLERECMILYRALAIPPEDVRGIGIHITKLSLPGQSSVLPSAPTANGAANNGRPRQVTLSPMVKKDVRPPALQKLPKREGEAKSRDEEDSGRLVLPPVDEVDAKVYDALPPKIKEEMERSYQRSSKREQDLAEAPPVKPEKKRRIVFNSSNSCGAWLTLQQKKKLAPAQVSRTVASDGEIDVNVFRALPDDVRAEVLRTHTISNAVKRKLVRPPSPPPPPPPSELIFGPEEKGVEHLARVVRSWMQALHRPQPVHMELIAQAAVESVERNAADMAYTILETMRRHAEVRSEWAAMYNLVLVEVQAAVQRKHLGRLPLKPL